MSTVSIWENKGLVIIVALIALHYGEMGHLRSQCYAMPVDQCTGLEEVLQTIHLSMPKDNQLLKGSESAISCSQSCYNVKEEENGGESPGGLIQGSLWKSGIPSRKRSVNVQRCLTPIERLQRELCNILKNDPSILSENEEDDLLIYNANNLQVSCNEIGLGGFLLKPNTTTTTITTTTEVPPAEPEKHSSAVDIKDSALIESQSRSSSSMGGFQEN
ncbi:uncharacterized protein LOC131173324 isoform X2 [Hevea brasiliensis]|uniref:uncharacterized protein LOC131173324 isoform X2 n=1 Tax=Hevea brasiliensis TaxID=3981 RepID=UPI0025D03BEC|nr:uncharacterized protein LOC131173324 isoform X2 [Hevea brasiliensis]